MPLNRARTPPTAMPTSRKGSINSQIIVCIEQVVRGSRRSTPALLSQIRALRQSLPGPPLTLDEIDRAKRRGRR